MDVQNDFCSGGALSVPRGDEIVPLINRIAGKFQTVVITQDWHPAGHISFASSHPGKLPFETLELPYGTQALWPDHCVMDSTGPALHPDLNIPHASLILRKGSHQNVDSYSAFLEGDRTTKTGLDGYLSTRGITDVYLCGLATDFCVAWSAEDARHFGFNSTVIEDACRAIDINNSLALGWERLATIGVKRLNSAALPA
ncbi:MAG: bifunctional nicotinamidase/pyrazinamidase [Acidocella sp.]|nr:bifunctional nicotinamidase/pyrazinamidase [Acidocella sp.]